MHQKVIVASLTSRQSGKAISSFRLSNSAATLSQSISRFLYNRKSPLKFWFSPFVCLSSVITLFAAPDPDLFDGRITTRSSDSESTVGFSESGGDEFGDNGSEDGSAGVGGSEGVEQQDLESVDGPGGGKAVENSSSKFSSSSAVGSARIGSAETLYSDLTGTKGGGGFSEATSKVEASSAGTGSGGTPTSEPLGGSGFDNQEPRNFDDFGFGGAGAQETVEINRSKESTTPTSLTSGSSTIPPEVNDFTTVAGQEATGGSQAGNGSLGGDYGTNLPSGL
tara:strand:+ start:1871 stop:2710 length:840 start_codon:yes stop_codon:yes gene_type:complete